MMNRQRCLKRTISLLPLAATAIAATQLPYNPTRIFLSPNDDYAYILQPGADSTTTAQFSSIDLTSELSSSDLSQTTLYSTLPFVQAGTSRAITSFADSSGNVTVIAGECAKGADGAELWRFLPEPSTKDGNGTWSQDELQPKSVETNSLTGANYLSAGIAWSQVVSSNASDTSMYVFAGMCPTAGATPSEWTTSANYSNLMVTYAPEKAATDGPEYQLTLVSSSGPPIAEAGFTVTGLSPAYTNNSGGVETQQQSFVLIGGHTDAAFLNMSQVALFSLPQESWSFEAVNQPSGSSKRDLVERATIVEPRSGHTAVLSEDGKSIVVFGGWVGDVSTAATPQLVVLELGSEYGGDGDWAWTIPTPSGSNVLSSSGIYGHGAVMLPGGVMMVHGGYSIASSSSRFSKRATQTQSSQTLFYNVTSGSWLSTYSHSASSSGSSGSSTVSTTEHAHLATTAQKAGLGVGLTVGILLLLGLAGYYCWYVRRTRRKRNNRRSDMSALVSEKRNSFDNTWLGKNSIDGYGGEAQTGEMEQGPPKHEPFPWLPEVGAAAAGWKSEQAKERDAERTGLFVNIPSPTRGLRKGATTRSYTYHAAPGFEDGRTSRAAGGIHPIEERDEEEDRMSSSGMSVAERRLRAVEGILSDPYLDSEQNPPPNHPVSPSLEAPPVNLALYSPSIYNGSISSGRVSPTKSNDERTSSTLSDQSSRSGLSARSIARTTSTRTNAIFGLSGTPHITPVPSPTEERSFSRLSQSQNGRYSPQNTPQYLPYRNRSVTAPHRGAADDDGNHTGRPTSFTQLQRDGEVLLGASPSPKRARRPSSAYSQADTLLGSNDLPPMPSRHSRQRLGWMGSLRKALYNDRNGSLQALPGASTSRHGPSVPMDPAAHYDRSSSSSPTKSHRGRTSAPPRRTASDSSAFLSLKRGQEDWVRRDGGDAWEPYKDEPDTGDWGVPGPASPEMGAQTGAGGSVRLVAAAGSGRKRGAVERSQSAAPAVPGGKSEEEIDWDVEKAAEMRDVQVMFTVPKARLRVVNADVDRASVRSVSDGGRSLKGLGVSGGNVSDDEKFVDAMEEKEKDA